MAAHNGKWTFWDQRVKHAVVYNACFDCRIATNGGPEGCSGCVDMIRIDNMFSQEMPLRTQLVRCNGAEQFCSIWCHNHTDEQGSRVSQVSPKGIVFIGGPTKWYVL